MELQPSKGSSRRQVSVSLVEQPVPDPRAYQELVSLLLGCLAQVSVQTFRHTVEAPIRGLGAAS